MKKWQRALEVFIKDWKDKPYVTGALVCGSYITGNPSSHSDIDIHIILSENTTWRERGNRIIDGILIEYFANPFRVHEQYESQDYSQRKRINSHMFATGRILFDKTGELQMLKDRGTAQLTRPFSGLDSVSTEFTKYHIWDMRDNLQELYELEDGSFYLAYYNCLYSLFDGYSSFLGYDFIPSVKLKRFLTNKRDIEKYCLPKHPDPDFVKKFLLCIGMNDTSALMEKYASLTDLVLEKMGGLDIDGWKLRTEL